MKKEDFFNLLKDTLEIEGQVSLKTQLNITSLGTLAIIAMIDENFNKIINTADIKKINTVNDLIQLIGENNFN